jgi:hypothetical protein
MSLSSSKTPVFMPANLEENPVRPPSLHGSLSHIATQDFLAGLPALNATGWIEFAPSGIRLQLLESQIIGASGAEPLGTILVRRGALPEALLPEAMARTTPNRPLGEVLLEDVLFQVPHHLMFEAMKTQILMAVNQLILTRQEEFKYYRNDHVPRYYARVPVQWALLEAVALSDEIGSAELGLNTVLKARSNSSLSGVTLSGDEWQILTAVNGRRNLDAVLRLFAAEGADNQSVLLRGYRAALRLFRQGLLELSAVMGLHTIVLEKVKNLGAAYHPPAGMVANLFIKLLDGKKTAHQIGEELRLEPDKIAQIVASLYRDRVALVKRGQTELDRLLDEY